LNPLAVMAARTNYLIAIRDLISYVDRVEIPVYLCDSIMTPSEYGDLFTSGLGKAKELKTSAARFLIPTEIATKRDDVAKYANLLESCVRDGYSPEEFIERLSDESLPVTAENLHIDLYNELVKLDKENKNSVWARIIKNAFAPLFIEKVDYIAGNPPWVNWESLPTDYRDSMKPLWEKYGLFSLSGSAGRLGGGKKDLSMLFVYSCVDNYLISLPVDGEGRGGGGKLGFVITQTVFKTKGAGDGFRQLEFSKGENKKVVLKPIRVDDMSDLHPFEGATNRTAVFVCESVKNPFSYPVPYILWQKTKKGQIDQDATLEEVQTETRQSEFGAIPVDKDNPTSPWLTTPKKALDGSQKVIGKSDYNAYAGACTWLNGVYWIRILKRLPNGELLIENLHDVGKIKIEHVQATIEPDLVYPLLRGRDVQRWKAEPSVHIILAQDPEARAGIPEDEMKREYPKTYAYFKRFEGQLRQRSGYRRYFKPTDPFWSIYNVGTYTMSLWKVVFKELATFFQAVVLNPNEESDIIIPDIKTRFISCDSATEGFYLCALLNATPAVLVLYVTAQWVQTPDYQASDIQKLLLPKFNPNDTLHLRIANFAERCHDAKATGDEGTVAALESEIDKAAAQLWGITDDELKTIQDALMEMAKPKRGSLRETDDY
jgi:hypothetical protein